MKLRSVRLLLVRKWKDQALFFLSLSLSLLHTYANRFPNSSSILINVEVSFMSYFERNACNFAGEDTVCEMSHDTENTCT